MTSTYMKDLTPVAHTVSRLDFLFERFDFLFESELVLLGKGVDPGFFVLLFFVWAAALGGDVNG